MELGLGRLLWNELIGLIKLISGEGLSVEFEPFSFEKKKFLSYI